MASRSTPTTCSSRWSSCVRPGAGRARPVSGRVKVALELRVKRRASGSRWSPRHPEVASPTSPGAPSAPPDPRTPTRKGGKLAGAAAARSPPAGPAPTSPRKDTSYLPASTPENHDMAAATTDRSPPISHNPETPASFLRKPCVGPHRPARYGSSHPGKTRSSERCNRLQEADREHFS